MVDSLDLGVLIGGLVMCAILAILHRWLKKKQEKNGTLSFTERLVSTSFVVTAVFTGLFALFIFFLDILP